MLRPGRFDRRVTVGLPDVQGREQILNVRVKNKKLAEEARGRPTLELCPAVSTLLARLNAGCTGFANTLVEEQLRPGA